MAQPKIDRRVQRTRQLVQEAFIALILEQGYNAVTIQGILDRANVGRSTFYAHYRDKEDVLASRFEKLHTVFEEHIKQVLSAPPAQAHAPSIQAALPLTMLQYIAQEQVLFKVLLGKKSGGVHLSYVRDYFLKYMRSVQHNAVTSTMPAYQLEAINEYIVHAFLALIVWWVDNDLPCTAEELYSLMSRLMAPGLSDVLGISFAHVST